MGKWRGKRKRRAYKAGLRHGRKARPRHKVIGGRTGAVFAKQTKSKKHFDFTVSIKIGVPRSIQQLLDSWATKKESHNDFN